ncbi:hypothetical protein VNO77_08532 [Canavalia gladiata]|uniref:Uncharacterized protein n=1 Tax=Canavalia gladiata TaxID=3824 RepID=A0AAN9M992_CANGL
MWLVGLEPRPQRTRQRPVNHQASPLVMHLILQINFKECFGLKLWFACCMGSILISVLLEAKILDVSLPLAMSIPSPIFIDLDEHLAALVGSPVAHGPSSRVHNSWKPPLPSIWHLYVASLPLLCMSIHGHYLEIKHAPGFPIVLSWREEYKLILGH